MNIQEILRGLIDLVDDNKSDAKDSAAGGDGNPIVRADAGLTPVEVTITDNTEPDQTIMIPPGQASFEMLKKDSNLDNVYDERGIELEKDGSHQEVEGKKDELLDIQRLAGMPVINVSN